MFHWMNDGNWDLHIFMATFSISWYFNFIFFWRIMEDICFWWVFDMIISISMPTEKKIYIYVCTIYMCRYNMMFCRFFFSHQNRIFPITFRILVSRLDVSTIPVCITWQQFVKFVKNLFEICSILMKTKSSKLLSIVIK